MIGIHESILMHIHVLNTISKHKSPYLAGVFKLSVAILLNVKTTYTSFSHTLIVIPSKFIKSQSNMWGKVIHKDR